MPEFAGLPIGWSAVIAGLFGAFNLWIGRSILALIRQRPKMRELEQSADEKLINTLSARVDKLEKDMSEQRTHYETKIEQLQARYDAEQRVARHSLNNVRTQFRSLMLLLKRMPDPPPMLEAIISDIEAMVAEHAQAEALEKGAQAGGEMRAKGVTP